MSGDQKERIEVTVRPARPGEETIMNQFWAGVNGDLSLYDYDAYTELDPGYLLTAVNAQGEPVGFGGISSHTEKDVYLGNFIVREDLRQRGIGRQLWAAMIERAGDRNIALDGELYMVPWYTKKGFKFQTFKSEFYNVTITEQMKISIPASMYSTQPLTEELWPSIMKYDRSVYPNLNREKILRAWFCRKEATNLVAFQNGTIVGYGSIHRKPNNQHGLRNVFGDNEAVIESLLRGLFSHVPVGDVVRFMKLTGKPMPKYVQHAEFQDDAGQRMYSKYEVQTNTDRMWLTSAHIF